MGVATLDRPARDNTSSDPTRRAPLVLAGNDYASVTEKVCSIVEAKVPPRTWTIAFTIAASLTGILGLMVLYLITTGVGVSVRSEARRMVAATDCSAMFSFTVIFIAVLLLASWATKQARGSRDARRLGRQVCAACGEAHPPFAQFCRRCGRRLP